MERLTVGKLKEQLKRIPDNKLVLLKVTYGSEDIICFYDASHSEADYIEVMN